MNTGRPGLFSLIMALLVLLFLALPIIIIFPLALSPSAYLTFPRRIFSALGGKSADRFGLAGFAVAEFSHRCDVNSDGDAIKPAAGAGIGSLPL